MSEKLFKIVFDVKKYEKKASKPKNSSIELIEYSPKSFAVICETKPLKDTLKELGGSFNFRLTCGAGWIFPNTKKRSCNVSTKVMKTILIYSGKGGVGKTTTTANIAKALVDSGKKVLIIDGDINTPSMSVLYPNNHPEENLWVHSTGHIFDSLIYFEKSMVRKFVNDAIEVYQKKNRISFS